MMKTRGIHGIRAARGVGEWAKKSINFERGCRHSCLYCYAQSMAMRFGHKTPATWGQPALRPAVISTNYRKSTGRIMFPTSHDLTPENLPNALIVLRKLLAAGNDLLIVSKPHLPVIEALCKEFVDYKSQILFRFTIGSADDKVLRYWEPNAPTFQERLNALQFAHAAGYATSVSCEPMLDLHIDRVIMAVRPHVTDAIWLGRVNGLRQAISLNCPDNAEARRQADILLAEQTDDYLRGLYARYKRDPMIKFKDSIKEVVGLERPTEKGLDV